MMLATVLLHKNLAMLLIWLTPVPSLLLTQALSTSPPVTRPRILFVTDVGLDEDDYGDYSDSHSTPPGVSHSAEPGLRLGEPQLCQYNPCQEDQEPCAVLSTQTGCLCPGLSGADQPPHTPRLQGLLPSSDENGGVEVQWCAPSSVVSGYRVVVEDREGSALEFGAMRRRGLVGPLEAGAKVCVEAVNEAGKSTALEFSCLRYKPPESLGGSLKAGVIGGGVSILLLLLVITALILWRRRVHRKMTGGSTEGLGNPSYSTEGNL